MMLVSTALACLALNVYHESRNQTIPGQYAVALVTVNRAELDNDKVCTEVFKPHQFSWTNAVVRTKQGWVIPAGLMPREEHAWWVANRVALMTINGRMYDFTGGSKFYHATWVRPAWRLAMVATKKIGDHRFYRPNDSVITD
jgi:spore germination cell wall hydrolase CwlJ-like protein